MIDFFNIMLGVFLGLIAIGYGNFLAFIYNRIKDKKRKSLTWCWVKGDLVKKSDCSCVNIGDDCSGCFIYEQYRTDNFLKFEKGDEPF